MKSVFVVVRLLLDYHHILEVQFSTKPFKTILINYKYIFFKEKTNIYNFDIYLKPLRSTEASELNLIIIKFEADTNILLLKSIFPERVAKFTALSSVRPPTRI